MKTQTFYQTKSYSQFTARDWYDYCKTMYWEFGKINGIEYWARTIQATIMNNLNTSKEYKSFTECYNLAQNMFKFNH